MKNNRKVVLVLVFMLVLSFSTVAFGGRNNVESNTILEELEKVLEEELEEVLEEELGEELEEEDVKEPEEKNPKKVKEKDNDKPWKAERDLVKQERKLIKSLRDVVDAELDILELQLKEAKLSKDETSIKTLNEQIKELKINKDEYKVQMKEKIVEMQEIMKSKYTVKELKELKEVSDSLNSLENVNVIPVENIFIGDNNIKFDTPPVIKEGRTLIPVRAISESLGAHVDWNAEEKIVTITKEEKVIVFYLAENKVYVNDNEVEIDVPAEVMNNRTMVPIRFIAEQLGLKVQWDEELQVIEIE